MPLSATRTLNPLPFEHDLTRLEPECFLAAMIANFRGDEAPLVGEIAAMLA